jgi:hypothetical protein
MGIELLLGIVVFPIAQKVGEKWIDRIATGIDEHSVLRGTARRAGRGVDLEDTG